MLSDPATANHLLSVAFEVSPAPQLITNQRLMHGFNAAFLWIFGYTREEFLGELILKLYPSQADYQAIGERCLSYLRINSSYSDDRFVQLRDGDVFWAPANGSTRPLDEPFNVLIWHIERIGQFHHSPISLTSREREISAHIVNGLTSNEIAKRLFISHRTVEVHRYRLMKNLQARNGAELAPKVIILK